MRVVFFLCDVSFAVQYIIMVKKKNHMLSSSFSSFYQPITIRQILDSSKLKEFADDNFKFDKNGRKLSKWVENTVGKGEIARHEKFLLFPKCFQKASFLRVSKGVIVWEWVNPFPFRAYTISRPS